MSRVLVTGGNGFLGRYVVETLKANGREVCVLGRSPSAQNTDLQHDLAAGSPEFESDFSEVYHLAGLAHFRPRSKDDREAFFRVNRTGTHNLLNGLERTGRLPSSIVFTSTVAVYGARAGNLLDEESKRNASHPYGASKKLAEDLILEWGIRSGVRVGVVRLPLLAGIDPPGNLGAMVRAMRSGYYVGIGDGTARRSMVLAEDVAAVLPDIAKKGGVFHLTDGHHPSVRELEQSLSSALSKKRPLRIPVALARPVGWIGDAVNLVAHAPLSSGQLGQLTTTLTFSDDKARQELGWHPRRVVDAASEIVGASKRSGEALP